VYAQGQGLRKSFADFSLPCLQGFVVKHSVPFNKTASPVPRPSLRHVDSPRRYGGAGLNEYGRHRLVDECHAHPVLDEVEQVGADRHGGYRDMAM
jgi:hypothetical protein